MELSQLSVEQINQAFLCLANQARPTQELLTLPEATWEQLAQLLLLLEAEKELNSVH